MIPAMIVAASTVAIVAIAAVVIVALIALIYIVPRGGRRRRKGLSWGCVLGTGSRFLRETQGSWKEGCV
jgi:uncharacterized BrkB/YihY/UPF0761 family membrane protein